MPRDFGTTFVTQCAPVMAGLKAANLFRWVEPDAAALAGTLASWRRQLAPRGVEIETLHFCPRAHAYLIYVYRPARLQAILGRDAPRALLRAAGYPEAGGCRRCLDCLCARLRQGGEFPHEIGVFLDYPLADVVGFIQNRGKNSTFTGYWKSYQDPEQARAQYARLRKCTEVYLRCYRSGTPVTRLTVAA